MRSTTRRRLTAVAIAAALITSACGDDADDTADADATDAESAHDSVTAAAPAADTTEQATESATTAADDRSEAFPRTVDHALGTTEITSPPERVVTLDMTFVDAALALEVSTLGYTTFGDTSGDLPGYFGDAADTSGGDAVPLGDLMAPNVEAIARLEPDLIISAAVRHEDLYEQLSELAPTIMSDSAGGGWKDNLRLMGESVGKEDLADELIAGYEARAKAIGTAVNDAAGNPEVSVVRFVDPIRLYQPVSFSGVVLADAGIARPESQRDTDEFITEISQEELHQADADFVFYTVYDDERAEVLLDDVMSNGLWEASLSAAREQRAIPVEDEIWMSAVGLFGADRILSDLAEVFDVDPHLELSPTAPLAGNAPS